MRESNKIQHSRGKLRTTLWGQRYELSPAAGEAANERRWALGGGQSDGRTRSQPKAAIFRRRQRHGRKFSWKYGTWQKRSASFDGNDLNEGRGAVVKGKAVHKYRCGGPVPHVAKSVVGGDETIARGDAGAGEDGVGPLKGAKST